MSVSEGSPIRPDPASPGVGRGGPGSRAREWFRRGSRSIGVILLAFVAGVWLLGVTDPTSSIDGGVLFAMGLVAAGVLLLRGQEPVDEATGRAVAEPRPRSPLGVLTLSVAFVVVGVMILLGNLDVADISMGQLAAAGLLIVGIGLVVGAWFGRSRFLILVGVVMVPFVIVGGFLHFPLRGSIGDRWMTPRSIDAVQTNHEVLVGGVHMNLAALRDFSGEREIDVRLAAGSADIFVPERMGLTVNGHIEYGNASIGNGRQQGNDIALGTHVEGEPGAGHLTINFTGGIASLYVERISLKELYGGDFAEGSVGAERFQPRDVRKQRREQEAREGKRDGKREGDGKKRRRDRAET